MDMKNIDKKKFSLKDVAIVIATYNRPEDVFQTLESLYKHKNIPGVICIVDQTKDSRTKNVIEKFPKLPIKYVFSKTPSSSIAKNIGIRQTKDKFKFVLVLDDDVDLLEEYLKNALDLFYKNPKLMALGGIEINENLRKTKFSLSKLFKKIFFLAYDENNGLRVIGPYGNTFALQLKETIYDVEWLPGFNMFFRSEVFKDYSMPESMGYNVLEDIDSSYHIFKKFGKGSLAIAPECRTIHRFSQIQRYPEKKRIFVNHEDHLYFYSKYFPGFKNKLKYLWSILGIIIGNFFRCMIPKKQNFLLLKYNLSALIYIYKNRKKIMAGTRRGFLNEDLSMKPEYI